LIRHGKLIFLLFGEWVAVDPADGDPARIGIRVEPNNHIELNVWSRCGNRECEWGWVSAAVYVPWPGADPRSSGDTLSANWLREGTETVLVIRRNEERDRLRVLALERQLDQRGVPSVRRNVRMDRLAVRQPAQAELFIAAYRYRSTGSCVPWAPVYEFRATVVNDGETAAPPGVTVQALSVDGLNWSGLAQIDGGIPPGEARSVDIQMPFLSNAPWQMFSQATNRFRLEVDPGNQVPEQDETNNATAIITLDAPAGCR